MRTALSRPSRLESSPELPRLGLRGSLNWRCEGWARRVRLSTLSSARGRTARCLITALMIQSSGRGDPVVIDMGANYKGYHSDLTRTLYVGDPDDEFLSIYSIVLQAQETAIREVRPGMTGKDVDEIARTVIEDAGYGDEFGHGLGHGVGLAVHERPMVVPTSEDVIEEGMIFTIEPGIYISGWGGVRIEDIVVMENGPRENTDRFAQVAPHLCIRATIKPGHL